MKNLANLTSGKVQLVPLMMQEDKTTKADIWRCHFTESKTDKFYTRQLTFCFCICLELQISIELYKMFPKQNVPKMFSAVRKKIKFSTAMSIILIYKELRHTILDYVFRWNNKTFNVTLFSRFL